MLPDNKSKSFQASVTQPPTPVYSSTSPSFTTYGIDVKVSPVAEDGKDFTSSVKNLLSEALNINTQNLYGTDDINEYVNLIIENGLGDYRDRKGEVDAKNQVVKQRYLLNKGDDNKKGIILYTAAIDTAGRGYPIDYYLDKTKLEKNNLVNALELIIPILNTLEDQNDEAIKLHIKSQLVSNDDVKLVVNHLIEANFVEKEIQKIRNSYRSKGIHKIANIFDELLSKLNTLTKDDDAKLFTEVFKLLIDESFITTVLNEIRNNCALDAAKIKQKIKEIEEKEKYRDVFDEAMPEVNRLGNNCQVRILFPYNRTNVHWLTGEILIVKQGANYNIKIYAHDPYGNGVMDESNYKTLIQTIQRRIQAEHKKFFPNDPTFRFEEKPSISPYTRRQAQGDGVSCGAIVAEDIVKLIKGVSLNVAKPYEIGAEQLRKLHVEKFKQYRPANDPTRINFINRNTIAPNAALQLTTLSNNNHSQDSQERNNSGIVKNSSKAKSQFFGNSMIIFHEEVNLNADSKAVIPSSKLKASDCVIEELIKKIAESIKQKLSVNPVNIAEINTYLDTIAKIKQHWEITERLQEEMDACYDKLPAHSEKEISERYNGEKEDYKSLIEAQKHRLEEAHKSNAANRLINTYTNILEKAGKCLADKKHKTAREYYLLLLDYLSKEKHPQLFLQVIEGIAAAYTGEENFIEAAKYYAIAFNLNKANKEQIKNIYVFLEARILFNALSDMLGMVASIKDIAIIDKIESIADTLYKLDDKKRSLMVYSSIIEKLDNITKIGYIGSCLPSNVKIIYERVLAKISKIATEEKIEVLNPIPYKNYQEKLYQIREATSREADKQQVTSVINNHVQELIKEIIKDSAKSIGDGGEQYAIVGLGSMARNELTSYSDIELLIIRSREFDDEGASLNIFKGLIDLIKIKIISLGETAADKVITKKGMTIDDAHFPSLNRGGRPYFIGTVKELVQIFKKDTTPTKDITIMLDGVLLHANKDGHKLLNSYLAKISEIMKSDQYKLRILAMMKDDKAFAFRGINKVISIKESLLRYPILLMSRICHYEGIEITNEDEQQSLTVLRADALVKAGTLSPIEAEGIKELISFAQRLRIEVQTFYGDERDEVSTAQVADHYQITEQEREMLDCLDKHVMQPLYELAKNWIDSKQKKQDNKKDNKGNKDLKEVDAKDIVSPKNKNFNRNVVNLSKVYQLKSKHLLKMHHDALKEYNDALEEYNKIKNEDFKKTADRHAELANWYYERAVELDLEGAERDWQDSIEGLGSTDEKFQGRFTLEYNDIQGNKHKATLSKDIEAQLLDDNNQEIEGIRVVRKIHNNGDYFHIKEYPEAPGIEYAASSLSHMLCGYTTAPFSILGKLTDNSKAEKDKERVRPVLISRTVIGKKLRESLEADIGILEKIDAESYGLSFIRTVLVSPEDDQPDNFIVLTTRSPRGEIKLRLFCIDNDRDFLGSGIKESNWILFKLEKLILKSILYCSKEQMESMIPDEIKIIILNVKVEEVLKKWLDKLIIVDARNCELFTNAKGEVELNHNRVILKNKEEVQIKTDIPVKIHSRTIERIYYKLLQLQDILYESNITIPYIKLLSHLDLMVGSKYEAFLNVNKSTAERFTEFSDQYTEKRVEKKKDDSEDKKVVKYSKSSSYRQSSVEDNKDLGNIEIPINLSRSLQNIVTKIKNIPGIRRALIESKGEERYNELSDEVKEYVINGKSSRNAGAFIDNVFGAIISRYTEGKDRITDGKQRKEKIDTEQRRILEVIKGTWFSNLFRSSKFVKLNLKGCWVLNSEDLNILLSSNLEWLDISNCPQLTVNDYGLIAIKCEKLKTLYIEIPDGVEELSLDNKKFEFKQLKKLVIKSKDLTDKGLLEIISLCPALEVLNVDGCKNVKFGKGIEKYLNETKQYQLARHFSNELGNLSQQQRIEKYFEAVDAGNIEIVILMLVCGVEVDTTKKYKEDDLQYENTALMRAADKGYNGIVLFLLSARADVNLLHNMSPLMYALVGGNEETVRILLKNGANPEKKGFIGSTAMITAAAAGKNNNLRTLLEYNVQIDEHNDQGMTALMYAAKHGENGKIYMILAKGANMEVRDHRGNTALSWAVMENRESTVNILIGNGAVNITTEKSPDMAAYYNYLGNVHCDKEQYTQAINYYEKALELKPDEAIYNHNLGDTYYNQLRYKEALKCYQKSLEVRKKLYKADHQEIARSLHSIGITLHAAGNYDEALKYEQECLEMRKRLYKGDNQEIANSLHSIGVTLHAAGNYDEALKYDQECLEMRKRLYGGDHEDIARSLQSIGVTLHAAEKYDEALEYKVKCLEMKRRLYKGDNQEIANSLHSIGVTLHEAGNYDEALKYEQECLEMRKRLHNEDNQIADSLCNIARIYFALKQYLNAIKLLSDAIDLKMNSESFNIQFYQLRSYAFWNAKKYNEALIDCEVLIKRDPKNYDHYINIGIIFNELGEIASAKNSYNKAITLAPKNAAYYNAFGNFYWERKEYKDAIDSYTKAINCDEKNAIYYINRAKAYSELNEDDKALADYNKAVAFEPNNATHYNNLGNFYWKRKEYQAAIDSYTKAINCDEKNAIYYINHANAYSELNEDNKALADYNKAVAFEPKNATHYNNLGNFYWKRKEYQAAIDSYTKAISCNEKNAVYYINRAKAYSELNENGKALADYNKAIALEPKNANYYIYRGDIYYAQMEYGKAMQDYKSAKRIDPSYNASLGYAERLYQFKKYKEAIKEYCRVIHLVPSKPEAYRGRGWCYFDTGEHEKASWDFEYGITLDPSYPNVYRGRSVILIAKGDLEGALTAINYALELAERKKEKYEWAYVTRGEIYFAQQKYTLAIKEYENLLKEKTYSNILEEMLKVIGKYKEKLIEAELKSEYEELLKQVEAKKQPKKLEDNMLAADKKGNKDTKGTDVAKAPDAGAVVALEDVGGVARAAAAAGVGAVAVQSHIELVENQNNLEEGIGPIHTYEGYQKKIASLSEAISKDPANAQAYHERGLCYIALQEFDQALEDINQAIKLDSFNFIHYHDQAHIYEALEQHEQAISSYTKAIELNPDKKSKGAEFCYFNRGQIYLHAGKYAEAERDFVEAIKLNPNDHEHYHQLGLAYHFLNTNLQAIEMYDKSIALKFDYPIAYLNKGHANIQLKKYAEAIESYTKAVDYDPYGSSSVKKELLKAEKDIQGTKDAKLIKAYGELLSLINNIELGGNENSLLVPEPVADNKSAEPKDNKGKADVDVKAAKPKDKQAEARVKEQVLTDLNNLKTIAVEILKQIRAANYLATLTCNGTKPDMSKIPDELFKDFAFLVLTNNSINTLPDNHALNFANITKGMLAQKSRAEVTKDLYDMLAARGNKLSSEVNSFAILIKLENLFNQAKDISRNIFQDIKQKLDGISSEQRDVLKLQVQELEEHIRRSILSNREDIIEKACRRCIVGFLTNLKDAPDENLGITPESRLDRVLKLAKDYNLTIDFRDVNLKGIGPFLKKSDLRGVNILLTTEQEEAYLTQEQRGQRNLGRLFKAAKTGDVRELKVLKRAKVNLDTPNAAGRTPLMESAFALQSGATRFLLSNGANINAKTLSGWSLIQSMVQRERTPQVRAMLDLLRAEGADINLHIRAALWFEKLSDSKSQWSIPQLNSKVRGKAPIHVAAEARHFPNVKWLVDQGADVKQTDDMGFTALHLACERGENSIALYLIKHGADKDHKAKGKEKFSPMSLAINNEQYHLAYLLHRVHSYVNSEQRKYLIGYNAVCVNRLPAYLTLKPLNCVISYLAGDVVLGGAVNAAATVGRPAYNFGGAVNANQPDNKHQADSAGQGR